jgi:hypothetical protein
MVMFIVRTQNGVHSVWLNRFVGVGVPDMCLVMHFSSCLDDP